MERSKRDLAVFAMLVIFGVGAIVNDHPIFPRGDHLKIPPLLIERSTRVSASE